MNGDFSCNVKNFEDDAQNKVHVHVTKNKGCSCNIMAKSVGRESLLAIGQIPWIGRLFKI